MSNQDINNTNRLAKIDRGIHGAPILDKELQVPIECWEWEKSSSLGEKTEIGYQLSISISINLDYCTYR